MNIPAAKIYFPEGDREGISEKIGEVLESGQKEIVQREVNKYGKPNGFYN